MTNPSNDPPPTINERYTSATHATNLKVTAEKRGSADLLIAAGWAPSRIGSALLRLHSEFDGASHPRKITRDAVEHLAITLTGKPAQKLAKAQKIAHDWYLHEVGLLLQRLKTLPHVRYQLALQADKWLIDDPDRTAVGVLIWWLDHTCPHCHGLKWDQIEGTPSLSARQCRTCRGSGELLVPYSFEGLRLLGYIQHCITEARKSIKKRLYR